MTTGTDGVVVAPRVPSIVIVHEAVSVVVNAIVRNFRIVGPMVVDQINVVVVGATSFEHGHHDAVARSCRPTCGDVPRQIRIDVVVSTLNVMPLLGKTRIVRHGLPLLNGMVELRCLHTLVGGQEAQHFLIIKVSL